MGAAAGKVPVEWRGSRSVLKLISVGGGGVGGGEGGVTVKAAEEEAQLLWKMR